MLRIPVKNLVKSVEFYTEKLKLEILFGSVEEGLVGLQLNDLQVILEPEELGEFEAGRYLGFSFEVNDIQSFYLSGEKAGVQFTGKPETQTWGGWMTHIVDPNGNSFSITQSRD